MEVILSAYSPDDSEDDWIPYLEIKVDVNTSEELLKIWDELIMELQERFSRESLEKIFVFLKR
ncbi:hypothetical protein GACE_0987 [Geoglobus acetivorans]|uniref:Uncharacterized protein n=1 Tax=Geoglobus acetivorans TaxID=565033 RepID=A0A0A7GGG5_GEOAI|nr:hypothetical protein GACE_0987 [Geoglobus acetivorans]